MVIKKPFKLINFKETSIGKVSRSVNQKIPDIWYYIIHLTQAKFSYLGIFLTLGLASINSNITETFSNFYKEIVPIETSELAATLILLSIIFITDFFDYWEHRLSHTVPFLWDLHEFHHSATEMTILSASRETPLRIAIIGILSLPIRAFTGLLVSEFLSQGLILPFTLFTINLAYDYFNNALGHSSLRIIYPKTLRRILMSPSLHWIHHSSNPKHFNTNFGQKFVIWDKIFGSYLGHRYLNEIYGYGVEGTEYNKHHPLYSFTILPVLKLIKRGKSLLLYK